MTLNYTWKATYLDETVFNQFDENGENLFKVVREQDLKTFEITDKKDTFGVNVKKGFLIINNTPIKIVRADDSNTLVYFRRNTSSTDGTSTMKHFVGIQYEGNKKVMWSVDNYTSQVEMVIEQ